MEITIEKFELLAEFRFFHGSDGLYATIEIAGHPVGTADVNLRVTVIAKPEDAGVPR